MCWLSLIFESRFVEIADCMLVLPKMESELPYLNAWLLTINVHDLEETELNDSM